MIRNISHSIFVLTIIFTIVYACKHEPVAPIIPDPDDYTGECHPDTIYFEKDLLPILASSCARSGCHDATTQVYGVRLTDYESVMATADVRPGNPNSSDLYEVLVEDDLGKRMPPSPNEPLSVAQIQMFYTWIMQGALNLHCEDTSCNLDNVTFSQTVLPNLQSYGCVNCHSGASPSGGIFLDTYNSVKAVAESGTLMGSIKRLEGYSKMPPTGDAMADCPADQIQKWIDNGMPDNK